MNGMRKIGSKFGRMAPFDDAGVRWEYICYGGERSMRGMGMGCTLVVLRACSMVHMQPVTTAVRHDNQASGGG